MVSEAPGVLFLSEGTFQCEVSGGACKLEAPIGSLGTGMAGRESSWDEAAGLSAELEADRWLLNSDLCAHLAWLWAPARAHACDPSGLSRLCRYEGIFVYLPAPGDACGGCFQSSSPGFAPGQGIPV